MNSVSASATILPPAYMMEEPSSTQDQNSSDEIPKNKKNKWCKKYVGKLDNAICIIGYAASITAAFTMGIILLGQNSVKKISDHTGNLYIILEKVLIIAVITLVALKIFIKFS